MWHYKLKKRKVSKEEAVRLAETLSVEEESFVGFTNEGGESLQIIRLGQNQFLLDVPQPSRPHFKLQQAEVTLREMKEVLTAFLNGEEWVTLSDWRLIYKLREIPRELREKSVEDLAAEMLEFAAREFPEELPPSRGKIRLFWLQRGVRGFTSDPEFELKREKVESRVQRELRKRELIKVKETLSSTVPEAVGWARNRGLKRVTRTDIDLFLVERELLLPEHVRDLLLRQVNIELRSKRPTSTVASSTPT